MRKLSLFSPILAASLLGLGVTGCEDNQPVVTESTEKEVQQAAEAVGEDMSEAASEAADAVSPDEEIVDVDTPMGDVDVERDRATNQTNVEVDAGE